MDAIRLLQKGVICAELNHIKTAWLTLNMQSQKDVLTLESNAKKGIFKSVCARAPQGKGKPWKDNAACVAQIFCRRCADPENTSIEVMSIVQRRCSLLQQKITQLNESCKREMKRRRNIS
jgi:hypothetical protein